MKYELNQAFFNEICDQYTKTNSFTDVLVKNKVTTHTLMFILTLKEQLKNLTDDEEYDKHLNVMLQRYQFLETSEISHNLKISTEEVNKITNEYLSASSLYRNLSDVYNTVRYNHNSGYDAESISESLFISKETVDRLITLFNK